MTERHTDYEFRRASMPPAARWALRVGLLCGAALVLIIVTWNAFFHYVPPARC